MLTRCLVQSRIALLLVAVVGPVYADGLDDYVRAQMRRQHIPGLSVAVVRAGKVVTARGYGVANVETGTPVTPETVYKIGSISKQFLAAAVLLLVQDGKLGLDDKVARYLDGAPDALSQICLNGVTARQETKPPRPSGGLLDPDPIFSCLSNSGSGPLP
jgi:CubicO group peptidase (beta-lactamase class C family)